jgi:4-hydroxythreonine-4-phosphate dehydrogenase
VNVTTSLGVVRTSPDHGVGYDIAGKGVADESSMRNAIYMAMDIYRSRVREAEYAANPLPHVVRERNVRDRDRDVKDLKMDN